MPAKFWESDQELIIEHVLISCAEVVCGDLEGVCIVPKNVFPEVFVRVLEKARAEGRVQSVLERGISAREGFETYGVL
jgi:hypothetical protein